MSDEKEIVKKFIDDLMDDSTKERKDKNSWPIMSVDRDWNELLDKTPQYTKTEIENRLYQLIDNETIFPPGEDMNSAYKLLNKFLDSLE